MNRKFILNLIFAVGVNLIIKPFWVLGVERGVQNALGAEQYGLYFSLFGFSFLFNVMLDFGINNYNTSFISKYPKLFQKKFSQLVILKLLLVVVYLLITLSVALVSGYDAIRMQLLLLLCLNQILSFFITYLRSNIAGLQMYITDSMLSVVDRTLMIAFCGFLLWGKIPGLLQLNTFILAQTLSYGITLVICTIVLKPHLHQLKWKYNKAFAIHLLSKSYPYAMLGILMGIYTKADGVLIERLLPLGKEAAGHYASAYRLFDAANMFAVLFAGLLLPMFSRLLQQRQPAASLLRLGFILIITPAILGAVLCWLYASQLMGWLSTYAHADSNQVLALLMCSFVFTCIVYIYGTFLTAAGLLKQLNRIAGFAVLLNLSLNLILIPRMGIVGAAWTSLITQATVGLSHFILTHLRYKIPFDFRLLAKIGIYTAIQLLLPMFPAFVENNIMVKLILHLIIGVTLVFLNVVQIQQFKKLIVIHD